MLRVGRGWEDYSYHSYLSLNLSLTLTLTLFLAQIKKFRQYLNHRPGSISPSVLDGIGGGGLGAGGRVPDALGFRPGHGTGGPGRARTVAYGEPLRGERVRDQRAVCASRGGGGGAEGGG